MKTFASIVVIAASASSAVAQVVTYNSTTGNFTCPASNPNGAFCAGNSLETNIIIRCTDRVGQPGNCIDNLVGEPPVGANLATCWQTSATSGDAACAKNCTVYGSSGKHDGDFTLPDCPSVTTSTAIASSTVSSSILATGTSEMAPGQTAQTTPNSQPTPVPHPTGSPAPPSNGTSGHSGPSNPASIGPTTTAPGLASSGAATHSASLLAAVGLVVSYFL